MGSTPSHLVESKPWIVLEYMQGGALTNVITNKSLEDDHRSVEASEIVSFCCRFADVEFIYGTRCVKVREICIVIKSDVLLDAQRSGACQN